MAISHDPISAVPISSLRKPAAAPAPPAFAVPVPTAEGAPRRRVVPEQIFAVGAFVTNLTQPPIAPAVQAEPHLRRARTYDLFASPFIPAAAPTPPALRADDVLGQRGRGHAEAIIVAAPARAHPALPPIIELAHRRGHSVTDTAAGLLKGRTLVADAGSYGVTGSAATLRKTYRLAADAGQYVVIGASASLVVVKPEVVGIVPPGLLAHWRRLRRREEARRGKPAVAAVETESPEAEPQRSDRSGAAPQRRKPPQPIDPDRRIERKLRDIRTLDELRQLTLAAQGLERRLLLELLREQEMALRRQRDEDDAIAILLMD